MKVSRGSDGAAGGQTAAAAERRDRPEPQRAERAVDGGTCSGPALRLR